MQYFEVLGHRGIWVDGWKAVTWHRRGTDWSDDEWELNHTNVDSRRLTISPSRSPRGCALCLIDRWWVEAGKPGVRTLEINQPAQRPGSPHYGLRYRYVLPIAHRNLAVNRSG